MRVMRVLGEERQRQYNAWLDLDDQEGPDEEHDPQLPAEQASDRVFEVGGALRR